MNRHPHYPPPSPQPQNNQDNQLKSRHLQRVRDPDHRHWDPWNMAIPGRAHMERCDCPALELVAEKLQHKAETDPAGPACTGGLPVLADFSGIDPAFHVLLAHQMRKQSSVTCWLFRQQLRI